MSILERGFGKAFIDATRAALRELFGQLLLGNESELLQKGSAKDRWPIVLGRTYLPWPKMRQIADRFLTHPEGEWRGWGWAAVLTCLRYHRDQAGDGLAMIRKRKFEQDPVRLVILQNLVILPAGTWKEPHRRA